MLVQKYDIKLLIEYIRFGQQQYKSLPLYHFKKNKNNT